MGELFDGDFMRKPLTVLFTIHGTPISHFIISFNPTPIHTHNMPCPYLLLCSSFYCSTRHHILRFFSTSLRIISFLVLPIDLLVLLFYCSQLAIDIVKKLRNQPGSKWPKVLWSAGEGKGQTLYFHLENWITIRKVKTFLPRKTIRFGWRQRQRQSCLAIRYSWGKQP